MRTMLAAVLLLAGVTQTGADTCHLAGASGDFEHGTRDWQFDGQVAADPHDARNHVLALCGEVPYASAPLALPPSVDAVSVRFRVLGPVGIKLRFGSTLVL